MILRFPRRRRCRLDSIAIPSPFRWRKPRTTRFSRAFSRARTINGKKYTSSTGFLPYRNLNYKFIVQIWNYALTKQLDTVKRGRYRDFKGYPAEQGRRIIYKSHYPGQRNLASGYTLWNTAVNPPRPAYLSPPAGITAQTSTGVNRTVMFTKSPYGRH